MGVQPDQFWQMTPRQLHIYMDGYSERLEDNFERDSLFTSYILQAFSGEKIRPKELFKRASDTPDTDQGNMKEKFEAACTKMNATPFVGGSD